MKPDPDISARFEKNARLKLRLSVVGVVVIMTGLVILIFGPPGAPYGFAVGLWGFVMIGVAFGIYWRCPQCDGFLGRDFKNHCSRCGTLLRDKEESE